MAGSRCSNAKSRGKLNETYRSSLYIFRTVNKSSSGEGKQCGGLCFFFPQFPSPLFRGTQQSERDEVRRRGLGSSGGGSSRARRPALAAQCQVRVVAGERGRWRCLASCQRLLRSFTSTLLPHRRHFNVFAAAPCGALPFRFCVSEELLSRDSVL